MSELTTFLSECRLAGYVVERPKEGHSSTVSNGGRVLAWILKSPHSDFWVGIGVIGNLYMVWNTRLSLQAHGCYPTLVEALDEVERKIRSWDG